MADFLADRLRNYCLLFGVLDDKDVEEMLPVLTAAAQSVVLTRLDSTRSRDPGELARWSACPDTKFVTNSTEGLDRALESGLPLVVCGSIYLVGAVRQELRRRFGAPPAF